MSPGAGSSQYRLRSSDEPPAHPPWWAKAVVCGFGVLAVIGGCRDGDVVVVAAGFVFLGVGSEKLR